LKASAFTSKAAGQDIQADAQTQPPKHPYKNTTAWYRFNNRRDHDEKELPELLKTSYCPFSTGYPFAIQSRPKLLGI